VLRTARRRAGLSQSELARRSGVPQPAISAYEAGTRQPAFDTAMALLSSCGDPFRLRPRQGTVDRGRAARQLEQVLELAEGLPKRRRPARLDFPPLAHGTSGSRR